MSEDSLVDDDPNKPIDPSSSSTLTTANPRMSTVRSVNLDEHIKSVKQKKDEVDGLRLQRFQEQLRKKEQKWQQQQLERVRKWLQLRNRDTDHRSQVEERRRKREEETRAKIDEILRREKEREQRANSQITSHLRGNASHKSDSLMSLSTDAFLSRRAISAPRIRSKPTNMTNRRKSNDSPVTTSSEEAADQSATAISSHQHHPVDGRRSHRSRHSHDVTITNEEHSLSGTPRSAAHSRTRPMPASYGYWVNTGDNNHNHSNASFMRSTYAATCRSRLSRSVERCPRACRARDDSSNIATTASTTATAVPTAAAVTTNGDHQRRGQSISRQHLDETIRRLSKPKNVYMAQSVHLGATAPSSSSNGISSSHSSHQLRPSTPLVPSNNHPTPTRASSTTRKIPSRPVTAPAHHASAVADSHTNPRDEPTAEHQPVPPSIRQSSTNRSGAHPKLPLPPSSRPPTTLPSARPKPPASRSLMTTSHSSSSLSSALTTATPNKQSVARASGASPAKPKPEPKPVPSPPEQTAQVDVAASEQTPDDQVLPEEDKSLANESTDVKSAEEKEQTLVEIHTTTPPVEPISGDAVTEAVNPTAVPLSKKEQQILDEQEYQRKLSQKIREAQQRMELERQREEERLRQLELEEFEREQEQIRLEEEQSRVEQERLQRAIEERERENELKRQEEQRLQQQREELERKQAEEAERLQRERQERAKKEEEERVERKKRLDLIMRRTRPASPTPKPEISISKTNLDETNGHDQPQSAIPHSISDTRIPTSLSTDNFLTSTSDSNEVPTPDAPKFKSPLIQSLLNKARNTRSTDNLTQSSMTSSQLLSESMVDESVTADQSTARTELSDEDEQEGQQHDSGINNTTNGHTDSPLSASTNLNSYHEHSMEPAATFQLAIRKRKMKQNSNWQKKI